MTQLLDTATVRDERIVELQRGVADLTDAVAARDTFIAVAAHELRNPMTPIVGQVEVLLAALRAGRCTPDQLEQRLQRVQFSVRRYLRRSTVLLDVARVTRGKLQLEFEAFDLAALLREIAGEFDDAAGRAGIRISVTAPDRLLGSWDRLAVEQTVDNLLSNALKYGACTPIGASAEAAGETVRIEVRDHSGGILAADRQRVFQRFERAVGQNERRSGFGIGLWVVHGLIQAMDGSIAVDDAPGGGARFTVTLPRHIGGPPQ